MIQDLNLRMDYQSTVTTSGQSTYYIDSLAPADAMPAGSLAMWKVICFTTPTAPSGTLTGTLVVSLQTCANKLFDSNAVTLAASAAITLTNIAAQTANIAPPNYAPWPYTPAPTNIGPIVIWVAIPVGCQQFLRTGYVFTGNFASIGLTSEIIMDGDKLLSNNFPILGADIK